MTTGTQQPNGDFTRNRDHGEWTGGRGVAALDEARRFVYVDDTAAEILGRDAAALVGSTVDELIEPGRERIFLRIWQEFEHRGAVHAFCRLVRGDDTLALVEVEVVRDRPGRHRLTLFPLRMAEDAAPEDTGLLTEREREILQYASLGLSNREIGARLFVAPGTVKNHLSSVYRKLGVRDRAGAVAEAIRRDLVR